MIDTKKLLVTAFASKEDYHQVIYIYKGITVNLSFDYSDKLCDEFTGTKMSQYDAMQVAIKNEENKEAKAIARKIMNDAPTKLSLEDFSKQYFSRTKF